MTERNEWAPSNAPLYNEYGSIAESTSAADLVEHINWDPRANECSYLEQTILSVSDELEVTSTSLEQNDQDLEYRVVFRAANRLRVALEVDRRLQEADADVAQIKAAKPMMTESGYTIPVGSTLWLAPLDDDGKPDFEVARQATPKDMRRLGWIWHRSAVQAIEIMTSPQETEPTAESTSVDNEAPVDERHHDEPTSETVRVAL